MLIKPLYDPLAHHDGDTVIASAGTVSLPAYTTTGDLNTGMWFPAADTIAWSAGGTEYARLDSAAFTLSGTAAAIVNSTVAIGFDMSGGTFATAIQKWPAGTISTTGTTIFQPAADSTTAYQWLDADGGTPVLNIDTTNEAVGIGTATPLAGSGLHIVNGGPRFERDDSQSIFFDFITNKGDARELNYQNDGSDFQVKQTHASSYGKFKLVSAGFLSRIPVELHFAAPTDSFVIPSTGNVGFGDGFAETKLEITDAAPTITGHVSTHSDADNSGAFIIRGKREDGAETETESGTMTFSHDGAGANDQLAKWVLGVNTGAGVVDALDVDSSRVVTMPGIGDGGRTNYDLKVGTTGTPTYGMIQFGNAVVGRTSYKAGNIDLDGSILFQNIGGPVTSEVEFCFATSTGSSTRFALAKPAVGNASYHSRSMLLAGPAPADTDYVKVSYWQTTNSIFDNLVCDTAGDGADLGVQNDLEVEGDIFVDSIKESTTDAGVTFSDDILLANAEFLVFDKASGNGIKVDTATPTFGFADLLGDQFSKNTGGTKPTLVAYNGDVDAWQFSNGDEAFLTYHIPHDYVPGTDVHLHVHWSQNAAGATGGTVDFKYFAIYAKGHNQASGSTFTGTPKTATFSSIDINDGSSGLSQYQHHLTEVTISAATATAALFDRDDFEPDGVIELTLEMDATNLTGTPSDPFIHYADLHYQTTGIIGTKARAPDFYA